MRRDSFTILLYHGVDAKEAFPGPADPHREEYILSQELFEEHLNALKAQGSLVRPLEACLDANAAGRAPQHAVVLTFDDGEASCYHTIAPLLERRGFRGDFFIVSRFIGQPGYMTARQLKELADLGHGIHSHSASHRFLTTLNHQELSDELAKSKEEIEAATGRPVRFFSCPNGAYNPQVIEAARQAGYLRVLTSVEGHNTVSPPTFLLKRFAMRSYTSAANAVSICEHNVAMVFRLVAKRTVTQMAKALLPFEFYDRLRSRLLARLRHVKG